MNLWNVTKLWQLLEIALEDLRKCEKNPNVIVDMSKWLRPKDNGICQVCLAGATMYNRGFRESIGWTDDTWRIMDTINYLRTGSTDSAYARLWKLQTFNRKYRSFDICDYDRNDPGYFYDQMGPYLAYLKKEDI